MIPYTIKMEKLLDTNEEKWLDVKGFEGLYQVSNTGKIRSVDRLILKNNNRHARFKGQLLKPVTDRNGYRRIVLCKNKEKKTLSVHRLMAIAFIPNPLNHKQVNHINGIKDDNRLENLEWCTPSENILHAFRIGLGNSGLKGRNGERHPSSKLKTQDVLKIKQLLRQKQTNVAIAAKFNISEKAISDIRIKRTWAHLL